MGHSSAVRSCTPIPQSCIAIELKSCFEGSPSSIWVSSCGEETSIDRLYRLSEEPLLNFALIPYRIVVSPPGQAASLFGFAIGSPFVPPSALLN